MLATSNKIRKSLPFDSRKSGTFEMIGKVAVNDARVCICVSYFC